MLSAALLAQHPPGLGIGSVLGGLGRLDLVVDVRGGAAGDPALHRSNAAGEYAGISTQQHAQRAPEHTYQHADQTAARNPDPGGDVMPSGTRTAPSGPRSSNAVARTSTRPAASACRSWLSAW